MIKIINGIVFDNNNKKIEIGCIVDDFTQEQEKNLIDEGFAIPQTAQVTQKNEDDYLDEDGNFEIERALRLNVEMLKTLAKKHGLTDEELVKENNENKTKKEIVALIVEKLSAPKDEETEETEGETSETMPNVGDGTDGVA